MTLFFTDAVHITTDDLTRRLVNFLSSYVIEKNSV
jgi:hypothetical protein